MSRADNDGDGVKPYVPVLVAIVSTFGLTVGGNYILVRDITPDVVAPDRYTGTQGRSLETRFDDLAKEVQDIRHDLNQLPPRELTERVLRLELQVEDIVRELEKRGL